MIAKLNYFKPHDRPRISYQPARIVLKPLPGFLEMENIRRRGRIGLPPYQFRGAVGGKQGAVSHPVSGLAEQPHRVNSKTVNSAIKTATTMRVSSGRRMTPSSAFVVQPFPVPPCSTRAASWRAAKAMLLRINPAWESRRARTGCPPECDGAPPRPGSSRRSDRRDRRHSASADRSG